MGCRALAGAGTPQGSAKTAIRHQHGDDLGQLARRCCERASVRSKGGIPSRHVARAENRPRSGEAVQAARQDFAGSASPAEAALISEYASPEGAPAAPLSLRKRRLLRNATDSGSRFFVRFPCGSGGYCAAFPAEAAVTAQRDGQRVAVLRPLSLRKRRSLRSAMDRGAVLRPLSLRKRRLLCSATDSGSRLFVRPPCGSGVCCAARRTAGRGSSSAFSAEVAVTARPAPAPRRRPPRWRAWPEGSCPSAHPASSRASPRPSRGPRANIRRRTSCPCTSSSGS